MPPEIGGRHVEIALHKAARAVESVLRFLHVAPHRVDLKHALLVVVLERPVVPARVALALRFVLQANRHCLPEDRQPFLERDDVVLVQEQERLLDRVERISNPTSQSELSVECAPDLLQREPHEKFAGRVLTIGMG